MTNELPLSHTSRQWLGLVAAKAKLQPTRQGERWLLHLTPIAQTSALSRCICVGLACSGNCSPSPMPRIGAPRASPWMKSAWTPSVNVSGTAMQDRSRSLSSSVYWQVSWLTCSVPAFITAIAWRVIPYLKRRLAMPKHPIAVELEAINREGQTQAVRDSGLTVQGYSVYLRAVEASGLALTTWVADYGTIGPAYQLTERLSIALAIPLTMLVPEPLMPVQQEPTT